MKVSDYIRSATNQQIAAIFVAASKAVYEETARILPDMIQRGIVPPAYDVDQSLSAFLTALDAEIAETGEVHNGSPEN